MILHDLGDLMKLDFGNILALGLCNPNKTDTYLHFYYNSICQGSISYCIQASTLIGIRAQFSLSAVVWLQFPRVLTFTMCFCFVNF